MKLDAEELRGMPELQPGLSLGRFDSKPAADAALARMVQRGVRTALHHHAGADPAAGAGGGCGHPGAFGRAAAAVGAGFCGLRWAGDCRRCVTTTIAARGQRCCGNASAYFGPS